MRAMQQARRVDRRRGRVLRWQGLALLAATSLWEPGGGAAELDPRLVEQAQSAYRECGAAIDNAQYPAAEAACQKALSAMEGLLYLIPIALFLGLLGLAGFLWAMRSGQFDDLDGAAERILFDDADDPEAER